jgi:hypothetical protein
MPNVIRNTDLSWEIPSSRADVDCATYFQPWPRTGSLERAASDEPRDDQSGHGLDLEDFEEF